MGFLSGGGNTVIDTKPAFISLQVQSSTVGLPIPLHWGVNRIAPNLLWYGDFGSVSHSQTSGGGGGKGGGGSVTNTTYTYKAAFVFGLCEGVVTSTPICWQGKAVYNPITDLGFTLLSGKDGQTAWSYLATNHPTQALGYSGTAMLVTPYFDMGGGSSLPNHNFEVHGNLKGSLSDIGNLVDADVGLLAQDFLTNERYGANFPAAFIDKTSMIGGTGSSSWGAFTKSVGIGLSPSIGTQEPARDILTRWMTLTHTEAVWTGSLLKFIPMFAFNLTGSGGWTWTAPTAVLFDLSDTDYVQESGDPVIVTRTDTADAYNVVRLEILDRNNSYQVSVVEQRDEAHIIRYGLRIMPTIQAHEITDAAMASTAASLILQRSLMVRNTYAFRLSWEYCMLEPMDVITVTDAALGLNAYPVRIRSIDENEDFSLSVVAEDFPQGLGSVTTYATQATAPTVVVENAAPSSVNAPLIFEPSAAVVGATPQVWIAASGGTGGIADPYWGGCQVWVSLDDVTYTLIGTITGAASMGLLAASLAVYSGMAPDNTHTLSVNCAESGAQLVSVPSSIAAAGGNACWCEGEILSFTNATLVTGNQYALTGLYRGLKSSPVTAHGLGAQFCVLDAAIFKYDLPASYFGKMIYLKLPSFNIWGKALQDISTLTAYSHTVSGTGVSLASNGIFSALVAGQIFDCGFAGTTVSALADCGLTNTTSIGIINLGARP